HKPPIVEPIRPEPMTPIFMGFACANAGATATAAAAMRKLRLLIPVSPFVSGYHSRILENLVEAEPAGLRPCRTGNARGLAADGRALRILRDAGARNRKHPSSSRAARRGRLLHDILAAQLDARGARFVRKAAAHAQQKKTPLRSPIVQ